MRNRSILLRTKFTESISKLSNGFSFLDNKHDYLFSKIEKDEAASHWTIILTTFNMLGRHLAQVSARLNVPP